MDGNDEDEEAAVVPEMAAADEEAAPLELPAVGGERGMTGGVQRNQFVVANDRSLGMTCNSQRA